jgi:hypothetical protein
MDADTPKLVERAQTIARQLDFRTVYSEARKRMLRDMTGESIDHHLVRVAAEHAAIESEQAAARRALKMAAEVAGTLATEWSERWMQATPDRTAPRDYQNGRLAGYSDGAAEVQRAILAINPSEGTDP